MADIEARIAEWYGDIDANHDVGVADRFLTKDCVVTSPMGSFKGPDEFKAFLGVFFTALPDVRHEFRTTASGNTARVALKISGTHTGPFATPQGEVPPTGNSVGFPAVTDFELEVDKFSSINIDMDPGEIMAQIGAT